MTPIRGIEKEKLFGPKKCIRKCGQYDGTNENQARQRQLGGCVHVMRSGSKCVPQCRGERACVCVGVCVRVVLVCVSKQCIFSCIRALEKMLCTLDHSQHALAHPALTPNTYTYSQHTHFQTPTSYACVFSHIQSPLPKVWFVVNVLPGHTHTHS